MNSNKYVTMIIKYMIRWKAVVVLFLLVLFLSIASENFFSKANLIGLLGQSSAYLILALGVTMVIISAGVDLSIGGVLCLSGVITIGLQPFMPTWMAAVLAILAGAVIGFINGFFCVFQKTEPFVITLGIGMTLKGLNLLILDGRSVYGTDTAFAEFGSGSVLGIPYVLLVALAVILLFFYIMTRTSFGRNLYAIGGNYEVAAYSGINAMRDKWIAFVICGMTAALGGILFSARVNSASAMFGERTALLINCSAVIGGTSFTGGVGGIWQSVIGIILLNVIENGMNLLRLDAYVQMMVEGLVIVTIIVTDLYITKRRRLRV